MGQMFSMSVLSLVPITVIFCTSPAPPVGATTGLKRPTGYEEARHRKV